MALTPATGRGALLARAVLVLVVLGACAYRLHGQRAGRPSPGTGDGTGVHRFGAVLADETRREISFPARVAKRAGGVRFLVHVRGYAWLEPEAAVVSDARLADLQTGLALLDWRLWDELWQGGRPAGVSVALRHGGAEAPATALVGAVESGPGLGDLVFLGSPGTDPVVLGEAPGKDCAACPLLPLEKREVERLVAERGAGGRLALVPGALPEVGATVTVVIRLPERKEGREYVAREKYRAEEDEGRGGR